MIDARATLDPVHGIARASNLSPPGEDNPLWTAAVDIGGPRHAGFSLHLVGACGVSAADALVRAAVAAGGRDNATAVVVDVVGLVKDATYDSRRQQESLESKLGGRL